MAEVITNNNPRIALEGEASSKSSPQPAQQTTAQTQQADSQSTATNISTGNQGCQGSSFIAFGSFLQACAIFSMLNIEENRMNIANTKFELDCSQAQQTLTVEKAHKQALSSWLDMGMSLFSATCTVGGLIADSVGNAKTLGNDLTKQQDELSQLQNINTAAKERLLQPETVNMVHGEEGSVLPAREVSSVEDRARLTAMGEGDVLANNSAEFQKLQDGSFPAPSEKQLNAMGQIWDEKAAAEGLDTEELNKFFGSEEGRTALENRMNAIDTQKSVDVIKNSKDGDIEQIRQIKATSDQQMIDKYKEIEVTNSKLTAARSQNKMFADFIREAGKAGFDMGKAIATEQAGEKEAGVQAAQFNLQQFQSLWQELSKNMANNYSSIQGYYAAMVQAMRG